MNSDFKDLLRFLNEEKVSYMIAGGYAVMHHSQPRYTKDLAIWIKPSLENADALMRVFQKFGIPMMGLTREDFATVGTQLNLGVEPNQIDLLTVIPGLDFDQAWKGHVTTDAEGFPIHYLGKSDLIKAKQAAGRLQDLADLDELRRADLDFE
jgi:hypothetical protein